MAKPTLGQQLAQLDATDAMIRAEIAQMKERLATGELISMEKYNTFLFGEARRIRDAVLSAPARYAAEHAAAMEVDQFAVLTILTRISRGLLILAAGHGPFPSALPE